MGWFRRWRDAQLERRFIRDAGPRVLARLVAERGGTLEVTLDDLRAAPDLWLSYRGGDPGAIVLRSEPRAIPGGHWVGLDLPRRRADVARIAARRERTGGGHAS